MKSDHEMAEIARLLARHLQAFAKERRDEDRAAIKNIHTELCKRYREELAE